MFFTQDDYKKIQQWLIKNSVKDTEFSEANIPFNGEETITIVQGNQNKKVFLKDLIAQVFNLGISDFVNITDKYDAPNISLEEAIRLIPSRARKEGQVITFLDREDHWHIYQFKGVLNQWNVLDTWEDLFDWEKLIIDSILPDEEDLTKSPADENGNSYLSLKDREYNPEDFSGLGRIILRKNIVEVEDPIYGKVKKNILYQDMLTQSNTIYEIRYDFNLNGQEITIPEGCVLDFQGGSLSNGTLNLNKAHVIGRGINCIPKNVNINSWIKLSNYLYTVENPEHNRLVFQQLVDEEASILIDIPFITFSDLIHVKNRIIIKGVEGSEKTHLYFPQSTGFIWDNKQWSAYNLVSNVRITSSWHCFDLFAEGEVKGISHSKFDNIIARSTKGGSCFYAGTNKSNYGSTIVFDNIFEFISVQADNGTGFYGLGSNTTVFRSIKIRACNNAFVNCNGFFDSVNGAYFNTLGEAKVFFRIQNSPEADSKCVFLNCNIEDFYGNIIISDGSCELKADFIGCNYIIPAKTSPYYPMFIIGNFKLSFSKSYIMFNQSGSDAFISCDLTKGQITTDMQIDIKNTSENKIVTLGSATFGSFDDRPNNPFMGQTYFDWTLNKQIIFSGERWVDGNGKLATYTVGGNSGKPIDLNNTGDRGFQYFDTTNGKPIWWNGSAWVDSNGVKKTYGSFDDKPSVAFIGQIYFDTTNGKPILWDGIKWVDANGFDKNYGSFDDRPSNPVISQFYYDWTLGRQIVFTGERWVDGNGKLATYNTGGKTSRPIDLNDTTDKGFQYYDTTLNKPIWWTGSKWVDATGADV